MIVTLLSIRELMFQVMFNMEIMKTLFVVFTCLVISLQAGCGSSSSSDSVNTERVITQQDTLVLNEVLVKGSDQDWIEFYNLGEGNIALDRYTIWHDGTDTLWGLPSVVIAPGSYYTVNTHDVLPLDSNLLGFSLGASDRVDLMRGGELVDRLSWDNGDALFGFSFGRYPDASNNITPLMPTPLAGNIQARRGPLVINEVMSNGVVGESDWFELYNNGTSSINLSEYSIGDSNSDPDSDGLSVLPALLLEPGEHFVISAKGGAASVGANEVPFTLEGEDSLRLQLGSQVVDYMAWDVSDAPQGYSYGAVSDGDWKKNTLIATPATKNNPVNPFDVSRVEDIYIDIAEADWLDMMENALDKKNHSASVTYKGVVLENIAIRTKGYSSLEPVYSSGSTRFSFKLDIDKYVKGQKLLGLKKFSLNNNFSDPTYMRDHLSYELMRSVDLPAPRTSYANLYVNGVLRGLYLLVEQVDSEFLYRSFENAEGDLYKMEREVVASMGSDLLWIDDDISSYGAAELKTNKKSSNNSAFITMLDVLNNGGDIESVIDVDAVLRYLAVSTAMSNLDSYQGMRPQNYYLYEVDGKFSVIPWDMNMSFGTYNIGCTDKQVFDFFIDEPTVGAMVDRPLIDKLFNVPSFKNAYHNHLQSLIQNDLSLSSMEAAIEELANMIRDDVAGDPTAFYILADFEQALTTDSDVVFGLTSFVAVRNSSIQGQLDGFFASSGNGGGSCFSQD